MTFRPYSILKTLAAASLLALVGFAQADVDNVSFIDSTICGGSAGSRTGTVTLDAVAGVGGVDVDLSDDSALLDIPATVHVNEGEDNASFVAKGPTLVATATNVVISASVAGQAVPAQVMVQVTPLRVKAFNWGDQRPSRGSRIQVTIRTNAPPAVDLPLTLFSGSGQIAFPGGTSIVMPAGQTSTVIPVEIELTAGDEQITVTVVPTSVVYNANLMKTQSLRGIALIPGSSTVVGGESTTVEYVLSNVVVDDFPVNVQTGTYLDTDYVLTVPAGSDRVVFTVNTKKTGRDRTQEMSIPLFGNCTCTTITVLTSPATPKLTAFSVDRDIVNSGDNITATVTMAAPSTVDTIVTITYGGELSGETTVTMLAGNTFAMFNVLCANDTKVMRHWTIRASANGSSKTVSVGVNPQP